MAFLGKVKRLLVGEELAKNESNISDNDTENAGTTGTTGTAAAAGAAPAALTAAAAASSGTSAGAAGAAAGAAGAPIPIKNKYLTTEHNIVNILVLGEEHKNMECLISNYIKINNFLSEEPQVSSKNILFVSEGRIGNPCFEQPNFSGIQKITEFRPDELYSTGESILVLTLWLEILFTAIYHGKKAYTPSDEEINAKFLISRMDDKGGSFGTLLDKINARQNYKLSIINAFAGKIEESKTLMTKILTDILNYLTTSSDPAENRLAPFLDNYISSNYSKDSQKRIRRFTNNERDVNLVNKVLEIIVNNPEIKKVVIIMGDLHFVNIRNLLTNVPYIKIDSKSSSFTGIQDGGKKKKSRKSSRSRNRKRQTRRKKH